MQDAGERRPLNPFARNRPRRQTMLKHVMAIAAVSTLALTSALAQTSTPPSTSPSTSSPPAATSTPSTPNASPSTTSPSASTSTPSASTTAKAPASTGAVAADKFVTKQSPDQFLASKFKGTDVIGTDDKKIGDVSDILFDKDKKVLAYLVCRLLLEKKKRQQKWHYEPK